MSDCEKWCACKESLARKMNGRENVGKETIDKKISEKDVDITQSC